MADCDFNLLDEPWIRVMKDDCTVDEVSLTDALIRAHEYRGLAGELPTQDAAVLRLLLAVLHAVFGRYDLSGVEGPITSSDDALDRWEELWHMRQFPDKPLRDYLDSQHENFWLFHPERPFWQDPDAEGRDSLQSEPVRKLNGALSESGNKVRLFSERNAGEKDELSYAEASRWLISLNQYDDNTLKTGLGVALLGNFAAIIAKGNDLFETLMLNFVLLGYGNEPWETSKASWEKPFKYDKEVRKIPMPHDAAAILSSHSRFGKLVLENGIIKKYVSPKGGQCYDRISRDEQMALWRRDSKGDVLPNKSIMGKQFWREFPSIIPSQKDEIKPLLVDWHNTLIINRCIPDDYLLYYAVTAIEYDSSQHSSVVNMYSDSLLLHADILGELGETYRTLIADEIGFCDKIANAVGRLSSDLFIAAGGDTKKGSTLFGAAKEQYYFEIDIPFRRWLAALSAADTETERNEKIKAWRAEAKAAAFRLAERMTADAGPAAFVGKTVKTDKEKTGKYYSSSIAMQWFRINMNRIWR